MADSLTRSAGLLRRCLAALAPATLAGFLTFSTSSSMAADAEAAPKPPPTVIRAGPDWIPLQPELEIEPGSALDFTSMQFVDAPAGKHGRVIARQDGQFAFEKQPQQIRRFYGVNLCFGAQYLSHEESDRLAERLVRLGYNTVRIHHYEGGLTEGQTNSTTLNPKKLDQFDYLMAALIRRGIYLTTDLYVSRSVPWREIGIDKEGRIPMDTFKILAPMHDGAYTNWTQFVRNLLDHQNPYTGKRYADEPALAWLSLINEGNFGNFFKDLRTYDEWKRGWNRWLRGRYPDRARMVQAWGADLKDDEDPAKDTVAFAEDLRGSSLRSRDCISFLSAVERFTLVKMRRFLRNELGCKALVSNANSWTYFVTDQMARSLYDYVDDHFYVDHPQFLEGSWRLPSRSPNTSPIADGAPGGRSKGFTRLYGKPFTITEYNYSGPGRFRGVGGILTGAMGALQGWNGIWRFAYSHSREAMFNPSRMGYFDLASDPLSQAAERASLCLFLRGDLQMARQSVSISMTWDDLQQPTNRIPSLHPKWHWMAWLTRVGTEILKVDSTSSEHAAVLPLLWTTPASSYRFDAATMLDPYSVTDTQLLDLLQQRHLIRSREWADPAKKMFRSETGDITIDGQRNVLVLDTLRTAGGYAPAGQTIEAPRSGVRIRVDGTDATVWVSALAPGIIRASPRLLVTHLTDLQNTEIRYAEPERRTLLDWGRLPHLVRAGKAEIALQLSAPQQFHVWALAPNGHRLAELPTKIEAGSLVFTADVSGDAAAGARMLYEVAVK